MAVAGVFVLLTLAGIFLNRPLGGERPTLSSLGFVTEVVEAEVASTEDHPCQGEAQGEVTCRTIRFEIQGGPDTGVFVSQELVANATTPDLETGDGVVLAHDPNATVDFQYRFVDRQRKPVLMWLTILFALAVVALGRFRGVAALVGLGVSIAVLIQFVVPGILDGRDPFLVALFGSAAIASLALYLAHGFTTMTTVAFIGTLLSLGVTALLAQVFMGLADFSGFATEEALIVQLGAARVDVAGLLLGGVVIGALGALDDMTVTQASAVWELHEVEPTMPRRRLVRAGLRIGRDHVASTVNTLALAYAGASMPILLLLVLSRQSLGTLANGEAIATEIVRTLVGSIGLVVAVPLTTVLAAWAVDPHAGVRKEIRRRRQLVTEE